MFPFFGRKKTRWELAREAVAEKLHDALEALPVERLDEWTHDVSHSLHAAGHNVAKSAGKAAAKTAVSAAAVASKVEGVGESGKHLLESAAGGLHNTAQHTAQSAHHLKESLGETLARTSHSAIETREALAARTAQTAEAARESAHHAREAAQARAAGLQNVLHDKQEAARLALEAAQARKAELESAAHDKIAVTTQAAKAKLNRRKNQTERRTEEVADKAQHKHAEIKSHAISAIKTDDDAPLEIEVRESGSKLLWTIVGFAVGIVVVVLLWPKFGRRNRAAIKDRLEIVKQGANEKLDEVVEKAEDLQQRTSGLAHEVHVAATSPIGTDNPVPPTEADDRTLADRVRSELGQTAVGSSLSLNIDSVHGVISVRGPMLESEIITQLEAIVRAVPGVRDVHIENLVSDAPEDEATFVG